MYSNIKLSFDQLMQNHEFQEYVKEYRFRFGIPENGFEDTTSEAYKNWIIEAMRKADHLKEEFLFLAKRCRNLAPGRDAIPLVLLAYYFLYGKTPSEEVQNSSSFSISPSGILGSFDITFTIPLVFNLEETIELIKTHENEIKELSVNTEDLLTNLKADTTPAEQDPNKDFLPTTPGNGSDIVDSVHRKIVYLAEFGHIILREHLSRMREADFVIAEYSDKNKPISFPVQHMGTMMLTRGLFPLAEEYWRNIDDEIVSFNQTTGKNVNRGIPLANQGVAQIAQGKVIEGLFNLYKAHENDRVCLQHLPSAAIDPERDLSQSVLFTQFEERQISRLFNVVVSKYPKVFDSPITENDLKTYILSLAPDKKILLFITLYRFSFSFDLNSELSNPVNRGEILRSLSELVLWYEDELKTKDSSLSGTLGNFMDVKFGQLNSGGIDYTHASNLNELEAKIQRAITDGDSLERVNAKVSTCVRNFTGHNFASQSHPIFNIADEIMARMLSLIMFSNTKGWV